MFNTLPLLLTAAAAAAATAAIAYAATAKRRIPITEEEATILWKIHKQTSNCKSRNMQPIVYGRGEIAGFRCQCGYRYIQKKPLLSRKIQSNLITQPSMSYLQLDASVSSAHANSNNALK